MIFSELDEATLEGLVKAIYHSKSSWSTTALQTYINVHMFTLTTLDATLLKGANPSLCNVPSISKGLKEEFKKIIPRGFPKGFPERFPKEDAALAYIQNLAI
jgi:hypothetical protein